MAVKGILLDLDNFLYEYGPCNKAGNGACFQAVFEKHGIGIREVEGLFEQARMEVKARIPRQAASHSRLLYYKVVIEKIAEKEKANPDYRECAALEDAFWKAYMERMEIYPNVVDFLESCATKGVKTAIVSDLTTRIQLEKLVRLGIAGRFSALVTSEEAGAEKPDLKIFQIALERLGLEPPDVVMLGDDGERDRGAEKLGIRTVIAKPAEFWEKKGYLALFE
jgi:putative hydrolase of the HAD superfamily